MRAGGSFSMSNPHIDYHLDTALFRDALRFTSAKTGFSERLIEKDYYCSVALADLCAPGDEEIVFKGGTCLSKIHADFFRLSEDLDFAISTHAAATRRERSQRMAGFKRRFAAISKRYDCFRITEALLGFNNSLQYGAQLAYTSAVTGQEDYLKVEVSVREPIIEPSASLPARTLLVDPFRGQKGGAERGRSSFRTFRGGERLATEQRAEPEMSCVPFPLPTFWPCSVQRLRA